MAKLALTDLVNLQNENTAVSAINANSAAIETAMDQALFRNGVSPNYMDADIDMNSNHIYNLAEPFDDSEPFRKGDADDIIDRMEAALDIISSGVSADTTTVNFVSKTVAAVTNISALVGYLRTAGYTSAGDKGGALYRRVAVEPSHAGKFQSADGAWWEIAAVPLTPQMFGAVADGVTDCTIAAGNAVAVSLVLDTPLYWPEGIYMVDSLSATKPIWYGDGIDSTRIKIRSASVATNGITVGDPSGSTSYIGAYIRDLTIDANSKCAAGAALYIRNSTHGVFNSLIIQSSAGHGLHADTATDGGGGNSYLSFNSYSHIRSTFNTLDGFRWTGEHVSDFHSLVSSYNRDGFVWENFNHDTEPTAVGNEECTGTGLHAFDCNRDGFRFDSAEKMVFGELISGGSLRYGMSFWFDTNPTGTLGNGVKIASFSSRNDRLAAIWVDPVDGGLYNATFGDVSIIGYSSTGGGNPAVVLAAIQKVKFNSLHIEGWPGSALSVQEGSPKGGATLQSGNLQIGNLMMLGNGSASFISHGLVIQNNSSYIQIANLQSVNTQTSGTNYEISCGSVAGNIYVGLAQIVPAAVGHEDSNPGRVLYALKNF